MRGLVAVGTGKGQVELASRDIWAPILEHCECCETPHILIMSALLCIYKAVHMLRFFVGLVTASRYVYYVALHCSLPKKSTESFMYLDRGLITSTMDV